MGLRTFALLMSLVATYLRCVLSAYPILSLSQIGVNSQNELAFSGQVGNIITSSAISGLSDIHVEVAVSYDNVPGNLKLFNKQGILMTKLSTSASGNKPLILKINLMLFSGQDGVSTAGTNRQYYTLQMSGSIFSISGSKMDTSFTNIGLAGDSQDSNYVFQFSAPYFWKTDITSYLDINDVDLLLGGSMLSLISPCTTQNTLVLGCMCSTLLLISQAEHTPTKTQSLAAAGISYLLDGSIDTVIYATLATGTLQAIDLSSAGTVAAVMRAAAVGVNNVGQLADLVMFGYMISSDQVAGNLLLIEKASLEVRSLPESVYVGIYGHPFRDLDRYYMSVYRSDTSNSIVVPYYFTVDRCTKKSGVLCDKCLPEYYLSLGQVDNQCVLENEIPSGYGIDRTAREIKSCTIENCKNCTPDYQMCIDCDSANGYFLINGNCTFGPGRIEKPLKIDRAEYYPDRKEIVFRFSEQITIQTSTNHEQLPLILQDLVSDVRHNCSILKCRLMDMQDTSFSIEISTSFVSVVKGIARLDSPSEYLVIRAKKDNFTFTNDIEIPDITLMDDPPASKVFKGSIEVVRYSSMAVSLATTLGNYQSSVLMDILICKCMAIQLLSGDYLALPEKILSNTMQVGILPIDVTNLFSSWSKSYTCIHRAEVFERHDISCDILGNEGDNIVVLLGIGVITAAITITLTFFIQNWKNKEETQKKTEGESSSFTPYSIGKKKDSLTAMPQKDELMVSLSLSPPRSSSISVKSLAKNNSKNDTSSKMIELQKLETITKPTKLQTRLKLAAKLKAMFGLRFFMIKMEGIQLQLVLFAVLNLSTPSSASCNIVGLTLSILLLIYFMLVAGASCYLGLWAWNKIKNQRAEIQIFKKISFNSSVSRMNSAAKKELDKKSLTEAVDFAKSKLHFLVFFYQKSKLPSKILFAFESTFSLTKNLIVSIAIAGFPNIPYLQVSTVLGIEIVYMIYYLNANIKPGRVDRWIMTLSSLLIVAYLGLKVMSLGNWSERFKQVVLGMSMGIILILLIFIGMLFGLYIGFKHLLALVRHCKKNKSNFTKIVPKTLKAISERNPNQEQQENPLNRVVLVKPLQPKKSMALRIDKKVLKIGAMINTRRDVAKKLKYPRDLK